MNHGLVGRYVSRYSVTVRYGFRYGRVTEKIRVVGLFFLVISGHFCAKITENHSIGS